MSSVLVFGASGPVGRFLLPRLAPAHRVVAVSRAPRDAPEFWLRADLNDARVEWPAVDAAICLGPLDAFAAWLQRQPATGLRRVIALSSMSAESKRESPDPAERALAARLASAETQVIRIAADRGIAATLFRPTLIYGVGEDRSLAPIVRFARRWRILPFPAGASGLRQPLHARDLAGACLAALDNPATFGKTYPLGGGERLRFDRMLLRLRAATGPVLPVPVPIALLRLLGSVRAGSSISKGMLQRLRVPLIADNTLATRDFGFAPALFLAEEVLPR